MKKWIVILSCYIVLSVVFLGISPPPDLNDTGFLMQITAAEFDALDKSEYVQPMVSGEYSAVKFDNEIGEPVPYLFSMKETSLPNLWRFQLPASFTATQYPQLNVSVIEYPNGQGYASFWKALGSARRWMTDNRLDSTLAGSIYGVGIVLLTLVFLSIYKAVANKGIEKEPGKVS